MLKTELAAVVGADHLLEGAALAGYDRDWTGRWHSEPLCVVRPATSTEVELVISLCAGAGVQVVVQGGNTGLVGGAVGGSATHVVVSTRRLREHLEFNPANNQLRVSAGYSLAEVQAEARRHGLLYPVDLAARDSATIGGTIATNAGGIRVVAYGETRQQVIELHVVTADGTETAGSLRDFVGSEGAIGLITEATLQFVPPRLAKWTALLPVQDVEAAVDVSCAVGDQLLAAELMQTVHANEVAAVAGLPGLRGDRDWWLLIEGDGSPAQLPEDALLAMQSSDVERFWHYRERHTETIARHEQVLKLDTSVPVFALPEFIEKVQEIAAASDAEDCYIFGHLMVGNLHLAFVNPSDFEAIERAVLVEVVRLAGSIAAEHGVGRAKAKYLSLSPAEADARMLLRRRFDPHGVFNRELWRIS